MEGYCPICRKVISLSHPLCDQAEKWFHSASGKKVWRIRQLNRYAYEYVTEEEYNAMQEHNSLILSDARSWDDFDGSTFTGIDCRGERTSIFSSNP
jgi:hypothetical protein